MQFNTDLDSKYKVKSQLNICNSNKTLNDFLVKLMKFCSKFL